MGDNPVGSVLVPSDPTVGRACLVFMERPNRLGDGRPAKPVMGRLGPRVDARAARDGPRAKTVPARTVMVRPDRTIGREPPGSTVNLITLGSTLSRTFARRLPLPA